MSKDVRDINGHHSKFVAAMLGHYGKAGHEVIQADTNGYIYMAYQAATSESAARIAELEASIEFGKKDSAAAWDKCEERRLEVVELEQKLVEISSLMTLWKRGLLTGDELGKSLFVVHKSKPAITNTGDKT